MPIRPRYRRLAAGFLGLTLLPAMPARAADIASGADFFVTPAPPGGGASATHQTFPFDDPLPAGFFGPGSLPFTGTVHFGGQGLTGTGLPSPDTDTVVRRLQDADLDTCDDQAIVPIEIVALSLRSTAPITVSFSSGTSSLYEVRATLSSFHSQQPGSMTLEQRCPQGGRFSSRLPVTPRLVFTRVGGTEGAAQVVLDPPPPAQPPPPILIRATEACWSYTKENFGIFTASGPGTADHDGEPGTPEVPFPASSSNFFPGVCWKPCECNSTEQPVPMKRLTPEGDLLAAHGVLPPEQIGDPDFPTLDPDRDDDGIHDIADNCPDLFNPLQGDADGDCIGDLCDSSITAIPTLSPGGLALLAVLVSLGGLAALRLRRA